MDIEELLESADNRFFNFENWGDWEHFVATFPEEEVEAMREWMDTAENWQSGYRKYGRKWEENTIMLYMALNFM